MTIVPGDRVLVKADEAQDLTEGGLHIPGTQEKPNTGTVVLAGSGADDLEVGDRISYRKHAGTQVLYEGVTHLVIESGDVLLIER